MNIDLIRSNFPYLQSGKIYFDHAAVSPLPKPVVESIEKYLFERSISQVNNYHAGLDKVEGLKSQLSELINISSERIAFTKSVTDGMNIIAQGLKWNSGDRIILNDIEFPANVYPFLNLSKQGVEIDFVKSRNGVVSLEAIENLITPNTRLISISFVQFLSGYRADLEDIGKLCKEKNIIFCVDGIQGIGALRLDFEKYNIDFLSGGSHKWLMALMGLGFIALTEELQDKIDPKTVGWISVENEWDLLNYKLELKQTADRFQTGTYSFIGVNALSSALKFFNEVGFDEIEKKIISNTEYFRNRLNEIGIEPLLGDVNLSNLSGIITFPIENAEEVINRLKEKNIIGSMREGMIRFSPHFYNTKEEIDTVIEELKKLV